MAGTVAPIKVGTKWEQIVVRRDGSRAKRVIEVIGAPTLSSPVNYRILQNDLATHRVGKASSIRRSELHRKYRAVGS